MSASSRERTGSERVDALWPALRRLDAILARALKAAPAIHGVDPGADAFRGLHISADDVERLLRRPPGAPLFGPVLDGGGDLLDEDLPRSPAIERLVDAFALTPFDVAVLVIALAPEIDLRYERLYAYLQDDVTRKRPSIDLVLNLLVRSAADKVRRRRHFGSDAPLVRHRLVHLLDEGGQAAAPLLAHRVTLDEQILSFLLGEAGLTSSLRPFADLSRPRKTRVPRQPEHWESIVGVVVEAAQSGKSITLSLEGSEETRKRAAARALAAAVHRPLLAVDLAAAEPAGAGFTQRLASIFREAWLKDAVLFIEGSEVLAADRSSAAFPLLLSQLGDASGIVILSGRDRWTPSERGPAGVISIPFASPDLQARRTAWRAAQKEHGVSLDVRTVQTLAGRFSLSERQIHDAVATAANAARARGQGADGPDLEEYFASARRQSIKEFGNLAVKLQARHGWADLVVPEDTETQLREMCARVAHRDIVLGEWGFERTLSSGTGVSALFSGSSGTGKTMAAEVIARELGLDLYRIDLAGVVSKYIGETEKNLDRIFSAAEDANVILFFDEADALFGKRTEVKDAHDRYANIETAYLLQKMETYGGVAILATNFRQNLDDAFVRRLAFDVRFPFPDRTYRLRIWQGVWPSAVRLADDVDLGDMATQFRLSGGNIRNIALAAAFLAADNGGVVDRAHLLHATTREFQKLGKEMPAARGAGEGASV